MTTPSAHAAIGELIDTLDRFRELADATDAAGRALADTLARGNKIMTCGNGGSAAEALHMAEELVGRYRCNRRSLPGISLAADPAALTCIANDYGYDSVFSRQVEGLGTPGDALILFSTSGNSPNIEAAFHAAKARRISTVALLGKSGGRLRGQCDFEIIVPSGDTPRIQEVHALILHIWLELIDARFPD